MRLTAFALWLVLPGPAAVALPVLIEAQYPGASAEDVVPSVAAPLELNLRGTPGVRRLRSLSTEGRCLVRLELERDADSKKVRAEAQKRVKQTLPALPQVCAMMGVKLLLELDESFGLVALRPAKPDGLGAMNKAARDLIRPALLRLPGVAQVTVASPEERVRIASTRNAWPPAPSRPTTS
jgi:multidrug efflux pump subunit AcrB